MPRVDTYGQRKVQQAALPGARKQAHETFESQGGQIAEAQAGFGATVARVGLTIQRAERDRADRVAQLTMLRQFMDLDHQVLHAPETGMLNKKGLSVMESRDAALEAFDTQAGEIGKNLKTDGQRLFFEQQKIQRRAAIVDAIDRHGSKELTAYETHEAQATLASSVNTAVANADNPRRIAEELHNQAAIVENHGARMGMGPEARADLKAKLRSQTHVGVIERLLNADNDRGAQVYFEEVKDQINGEQLARIEKALEEGSLRGASQRAADEIIGVGGTLAEQREKVRAIQDPKLRDAVEQRVEHNAAIEEREEREANEQRLTDAYNLVDQKGTVNAIPAAHWAQLPGSARSALRSYAEHLAKGEPVKTDLPTYYALMEQASTDPTTFLGQNLLNYRHKLDETEFKQMAALQASLRKGDRKAADDALDGFRTNQQIVDDTLRLAGIDTGDSKDAKENGDVERVARFRRTLDDRVQALQRLSGKKATNADVQQIADDLLKTVTIEKGSWTNIVPGGAPFYDVAKRLVDLTPADVPAGDRAQIEQALRRRGRPVNDAAVLNLYIAHKRQAGAVK
jgi:hypothetical protein